MNLEHNPTMEQLRDLVKRCDDSAGHHILWVKKSGEVKISRVPQSQTPVGFEEDHKDMQMRLETFQAGNEYVGPEAAEDAEWITELFDRLTREWAGARGKPDVAYIGEF